MNTTIIIPLLAFLLLNVPSRYTANAKHALLQKTAPMYAVPAKLDLPYTLVLSLSTGRNATSAEASGTVKDFLPVTVLTLTNSSHHTLGFLYSGHFAHFEVEYKSAASGPTSNAGWENLKSNVQLPADTSLLNKYGAGAGLRSILGKLQPKQQWVSEQQLIGFDLSPEGFYRIRGIMDIPNVAEIGGSASSPTPIRTFTLSLHSNPIIIRRTPNGFVRVDAVTNE